jgi:hypothetical protein
MKRKLNYLFALLISSMSFLAQSNHATISKLAVSYKPIPTASLSSLGEIQCIAQATVTLKPNSGASKVYFKILSKQDNSVLYQVNYDLNSAPVTDNSDVRLFENSNGTIKIGYGNALILKPYLYQVQTADAQNNLTSIFSQTN